MPNEWSVRGDFEAVLDGLEQATLRRRSSAAEVTIAGAWRYDDSAGEAEPSGGRAIQADIAWQFELDAGEPPPAVGDSFIDGAGECWTVLRVETLRGASRYRCATRSLRIAYELTDWVDIDYEHSPGQWRRVRSHVAARVQPLETTIDRLVDSAEVTRRARVLLGEQLELDADNRLVDPSGRVFLVERIEQADRIDAPQVVVAVEQ